MFKLVKILGSRTNVPDICEIPIDGVAKCMKDCPYYLVDGALTAIATNTKERLVFIPIEDIPANSGRKKVKGYYVTPDMIFEAQYSEDPALSCLGETASYFTDNEANIGVGTIEGSDLKIVNIDSLYITGLVHVVLRW
jgi:hypothetical protein